MRDRAIYWLGSPGYENHPARRHWRWNGTEYTTPRKPRGRHEKETLVEVTMRKYMDHLLFGKPDRKVVLGGVVNEVVEVRGCPLPEGYRRH